MARPLKHPNVRQRTNKVSTAATLPAEIMGLVPHDLPMRDILSVEGTWHPMTTKWWQDVWDSPMQGEYVKVDVHAMYRMAMLVDAYWKSETPREMTLLSAELRLVGQSFGLTPLDRRRLQWTVATTSEAERKARTAETRGEDEKPRGPSKDPRGFLRAIEG